MNTTNEQGPSLFAFKLEALAILAIVACLGGLTPLKYVSRRFLTLGNTFSGGVFLSAGFIHMLAESVHGFEERGMTSIPYPYICCVIGILIPLCMEKVILGSGGSHSHGVLPLHVSGECEGASQAISPKNKVNMYMLSATLSVHSLIEGLALGVETTKHAAMAVFIAIVAHKFFAGFALGVSLVKSGMETGHVVRVILMFAITTPVGVMLALTFTSFAEEASMSNISQFVKALAAGTFIYVALVDVLVGEFDRKQEKDHKGEPNDNKATIKKFLMVLVGVFVMTLVSLWHHHSTESNTL